MSRHVKKIVAIVGAVGLVVGLSGCTTYGDVKADHTTPAGVTKLFLYGFADKNSTKVCETIDPESVEVLQLTGGCEKSIDNAIATNKQQMTKKEIDELRFKEDINKDKATVSAGEQGSSLACVKVDGKWYVDGMAMLGK